MICILNLVIALSSAAKVYNTVKLGSVVLTDKFNATNVPKKTPSLHSYRISGGH